MKYNSGLDYFTNNLGNDASANLKYWLPGEVGRVANNINTATQELSTATISDAIDKAFTYYGGFTKIVFYFQIVAVAYIVICLMKYIYTSYFGENHKYAPTLPQILKKVVVALLLTVALPYIVFTGYYVSSEAGMLVANVIADTDTTTVDSDLAAGYQFYEDLKYLDIPYTAYCVFDEGTNAPNETTSGKISAFINPTLVSAAKSDDDVGWKTKLNLQNTAGTDDTTYDEVFAKYQSVWNMSCGYNNTDGTEDKADETGIWQVYEGMVQNPSTAKVANVFSNTKGFFQFFGSIFGFLITLIVLFISVQSLVVRLINCITMIVMGWYSLGSSITDEGEKVLQGFAKRLFGICLTQFAMIVEISLYLKLQVSNNAVTETGINGLGGIFFSIASNIAWLLAIKSTPQIVDGMMGDTGSADTAGSLTKGLVGLLSKK